MMDVQAIAAQMANVGASLIEARIRSVMRTADVTADDLKAGRAYACRTAIQHTDCSGTGVKSVWEGSTFVSVELCKCLEIVIVKKVGE